jgi:hypothetical protein
MAITKTGNIKESDSMAMWDDGYNAGCIAQAKADRVEIEKTKPPCGECNPGNGQCGFCSYTDNVDDFYEDVMARLAAAQIVKG